MHKKAVFTFWITLILYVFTLLTVTYVGVYLTYIAMPLISISGLIMMLSKPSEKKQEVNSNIKTTTNEVVKATSNFLNETAEVLNDFNDTLDAYSKKSEKRLELRKRLRILKQNQRDFISIPTEEITVGDIEENKRIKSALDNEINLIENSIKLL